ncbi:MAG: histidinol-phosphate transaminase [Thermotogota bacterium]
MRFRKNIIEMEAYTVPKKLPPVRLDKNESPFDVPLEIKKKVFEYFHNNPFNRYPEIDSLTLRAAIAEDKSIDPEQVFVSNGGDALIPEILSLFEGEQVVTFQPTFSMYGFYALRYGLNVNEVELNEGFSIPDSFVPDPEKMALVVICSPNNPTGNDMTEEKIRKILDTGVPVLLDQAYVEFSEKNYLPLLNEYENLIILRTFSKAFGMSGLRIGYAITSKIIADHFRRAHAPFSMNIFSAEMALEMLKHKAIIQEKVRFIKRERDKTQEELANLVPVKSSANFVLLKTDAYNFLFQRGIAVRKYSGKLNEYIRVTIGTEEENEAVKRLIREFESKHHTWIH